MIKKLVGALVVLVVVAGVAAVYWFVVRDDEPGELGLDSDSDTEEPAGETLDNFDGRWIVEEDGDSQAGFRIEEEFIGTISHTAVGRSPEVEGEITIIGTEVIEGSFTVDLTALEFTDDPPTGSVGSRAGAMEDQGLETNEFPEATFTLTEPIDVGEIPGDRETITAEATGNLALHGVTKSVTFSVDAQVSGSTIRVASTDPVPVVLADYQIEEPTAPIIASVSDEGSFEFLLVFAPA